MGCGLPNVRLTKNSSFTQLSATIMWGDGNCRFGTLNSRVLRWQFLINGRLRYQTPFAAATATLPIGTGSTYQSLNASPADISAYLIGLGYPLLSTDRLQVRVQARNCNRLTDVSNNIVVPVVISLSTCPCNYAVANATGQTGNTATLPGGFTPTAGLLAFRNGLLNYGGTNFSADPLLTTDHLMFVTLGGCTATFDQVTVTAQTGTVTIPSAFNALPAKQYLVYRNGAALYDYSISSGQLTPADGASLSTDQWQFVRITNSTDGCHFGATLIGANVTGSTFTLPAGYTAANTGKWLVIRGGLTMETTTANPTDGYSVSGSTVTLATAAAGEEIWIQPII